MRIIILFYSRFEEYKYILIYQLDAYVFRDELLQWCNNGYDYVGAPLIGKYQDTDFSDVMRVGNGGFSLRKVHAYVDFFRATRNVFSCKQIVRRVALWDKPYTRIFVLLLMLLGWHNKPKSVASLWRYNEDDFWSGLLDDSNYSMKKPSVRESMDFAFERFPSDLFNITNRLPFGCHAWRKYEYVEFWKNILVEEK